MIPQSAFRNPKWESVPACQLASVCALHLGPAVAIANYQSLTPKTEFDEPAGRARAELLWALRAATDRRIEPFAVGERQWREDDSSTLIEMARREGLEISV